TGSDAEFTETDKFASVTAAAALDELTFSQLNGSFCTVVTTEKEVTEAAVTVRNCAFGFVPATALNDMLFWPNVNGPPPRHKPLAFVRKRHRPAVAAAAGARSTVDNQDHRDRQRAVRQAVLGD